MTADFPPPQVKSDDAVQYILEIFANDVSTLYRAHSIETGEPLLIKSYPLELRDDARVLTELDIFTKFRSEFVPKLVGSYDQDGRLVAVLASPENFVPICCLPIIDERIACELIQDAYNLRSQLTAVRLCQMSWDVDTLLWDDTGEHPTQFLDFSSLEKLDHPSAGTAENAEFVRFMETVAPWLADGDPPDALRTKEVDLMTGIYHSVRDGHSIAVRPRRLRSLDSELWHIYAEELPPMEPFRR